MRKREEITNPNSCFNKARMDEMVFVLLERDVAAPSTIRHWIQERVARGKNVMTDPQIEEALLCSEYMARTTNKIARINTIRSVLKNAQHSQKCKASGSTHCICGVYSAQNYFEQLMVDTQTVPPQHKPFPDETTPGEKCNICNRPDCDTPNQKH